VALFVSLLVLHSNQKALKEDLLSLRLELQQLSNEVSSSHDSADPKLHDRMTVLPESLDPKLTRVNTEIASLRDSILQLQRENASLSNQLVEAGAVQIPFLYQDSVKRGQYIFSGYDSPQSALQSVLWAITRSNVEALKGSVAGLNADRLKQIFQDDLPEGVMPSGFNNGEMFKATGFRVLEESKRSEDEITLKVLLEGSRTLVKATFKKIEGEWKWTFGG